MKAWLVLSLAFLASPGLAATPGAATAPGTPAGAVRPATGSVTGMPAASKSAKSSADQVTVHRCTDPKGRVTLQDEPCPKGSKDEPRTMVRPKDPPVTPRSERMDYPSAFIEPLFEEPPPPRELIPPPPMFYCTSYDGIERYSESYDPNPRCEPLVLYYPYSDANTASQGLGCRWVEDSCVRLSDEAACQRWWEQRKEAVSELQRSFSDTAAYRKSELERLTQITNESCP